MVIFFQERIRILLVQGTTPAMAEGVEEIAIGSHFCFILLTPSPLIDAHSYNSQKHSKSPSPLLLPSSLSSPIRSSNSSQNAVRSISNW